MLVCHSKIFRLDEVDTGAAFSIIFLETYKRLFPSNVLQKSDIRLKMYTGEPVGLWNYVS